MVHDAPPALSSPALCCLLACVDALRGRGDRSGSDEVGSAASRDATGKREGRPPSVPVRARAAHATRHAPTDRLPDFGFLTSTRFCMDTNRGHLVTQDRATRMRQGSSQR